MSSSDSDSSDSNEYMGEEKCLFDDGRGVVVGSLILWPYDRSSVRSVPKSNDFQDIPTKEYLDNISQFDWLDIVRKHVYCLIRAINFQQKAASTGIRLSPNYIATTRHSSEAGGGLYPFNTDAVVRSVIDLSEFKDSVFVKKLINASMYSGLIGNSNEFINFNERKIRVDTSFDFNLISAQKMNTLPRVEEGAPYIIPSQDELQIDTSIIVMGYPQFTSQKKLDASYGKGEAKPSVKNINKFFAAGWKTASLGKVKYTNGYHALLSAASCSGMSGSPVFTFSGKLVGFLTGSKPGCPLNIMILVSHPTFVVEYCMYCGNELLETNASAFGPKLAPFVTKNWVTLKKAINTELPDLDRFVNNMKCYL